MARSQSRTSTSRRGGKRGSSAWQTDDKAVRVGEITCRFRSPDAADQSFLASACLIEGRDPLGPMPSDFRPIPRFSVDKEGRNLIRVDTDPTVSLYGTGEVAGPMLRNCQTTTLWNTDSFGYDIHTPALYQSHPWVLAVRSDGSAFGVLIDSTYRMEIDLTAGIHAKCDGPPPPVYIVNAESPQRVLEKLAKLVGTTPLPPLWALGFHQCRYSYETQDTVLEIAKGFRDRDMPCDVIWCDIDYMDGYRVFTFNSETFPNPTRMARDMADIDMRVIYILDPGIKIDDAYPAYTEGLAGDHFVRKADGDVFHGEVWPGTTAFPDFLRADTRAWWGELCAEFVHNGAAGLWTDMNEPAVFDGPDHTLPLDCQHQADDELGGPGTHDRYHNIYGMQMARATYEGLKTARPEERPFVLSRSNFLGGNRFAALWTGDSASTWDHLSWTVPMMVNLGLSGQPFAGCDIGGFSENATPELFARWMGIGCLLPFARAHSDKNTNPHEPWSFGDECEHASRLALHRRYRLLPYLYTLFHEAEQCGLPVMRPLFFADPADPQLRDVDDGFMLGRDLLVRCSITEDNVKTAPMPAGVWRKFEPCPDPHLERKPDSTSTTNPHLPDLYIRGGAIIPLGPVSQHTGEKRLDPLTLVVCLDDNGYAEGTLYEDAGDGFEHLEGDYLRTTYIARRENNRVVVGISGAEGERKRPLRAAEILVVLPGDVVVRGTGLGGDTIPLLLPDDDEAES
ncbi:MAG: TIM-barrel domain-containing protein [Planctomycetota bacterium]